MMKILSGKAKYLYSAGLPVAALAIYLMMGPVPVASGQCNCYYGGGAYSPGANISDSCGGTKIQTCYVNNGGNCAWSECHPPSP